MKLIDPADSRSPYEQIAASLADAIRTGEFAPGEQLPSRATLAEQFGVAPMTVQSAIRVLRELGLVGTRQGAGVFVLVPPPAGRDLAAEVDDLQQRVAQLEALIEAMRQALGSR